MKKDFLNLKRSRWLLLTLFALLVGASPTWAQKALPYSYGFEEASCSTSGWTEISCNTSSENYNVGSSGVHEGTYAYRFYYNATPPYQYLISPELATSSYSLNVSFWYKAYSSSWEESFKVGYSTTDTETSSFTFGDEVKTNSTDWQEYTTTCPAGTKYICIACTSNNKYFLYIDDLVIDSDSPYKTPKAFASTGVTGTTATFSWTAGNDESAWQIAYSTTQGFDADGATKVDVTTNPYTLEGLTAETTYYARIRADYGSGNYSSWSSEVSFKPTNAITTTVNDGSSTNSHVPFNGNYADTEGTMSQFIIPSSTLTSLQGRMIQDMTFYTSTATKDFGNARFDVYMAETSTTAFDAATFDWSDMDKVATSATVNIADGKMTITLDEGFNYSGDNLMIGFNLVATGGYTATSWYGIEATNAAIKNYTGYSGGATIESFLPKITFTSLPGVPVAVKKPKNLAASEIGAATATLGWTDGEDGLTEWQIAYSTDADFAPDTEGTKVAADANPYTLTELTASTTYYAYVRAKKGEDYSKWSDKASFTTTERYPAPAGLTISNLTTTSATLTWTAGEATAWEVAVNTTGTTPDAAGTVVNAATYNFTELTEETTYYAFVRTKDGDNYSAWSAACEFLPSANTYLTVNDGTTTNEYVPITVNTYGSSLQRSQFVIPASELASLVNKDIKKFTFYATTESNNLGDMDYDVYLKEVDNTTITSSTFTDWNSMTKVYSGKLSVSGGKMNILLTSDFNYTGKSLLVGIYQTSTGTGTSLSFYGKSTSSYMAVKWDASGNERPKFAPKTTIGYQEKTGSELKVFDGETELAVSPASFDFDLAEAGTTHTFTLKNTAATPYVATISSTNLTVSPTEVTPTAEGVTFTVTMPDNDITNEPVVITPAVGSGLEAFTINVSGTLRNLSKFYENGFNALPSGWSVDGSWSYTAANGATTSAWYINSGTIARLKTPMLTVAADEKFIVEAKGNYAGSQHVQLQYSTDGTNWTNLGDELELTSSFKTFTVTVPGEFVAGNYYIGLLASQASVRMFYGGEKVSGANFAINTDGSTQNFGSVKANATAEKTFTVSNNGNATLNVTLAAEEGFTAEGNALLFTNNKGWSKVYVHAWNGEGDLTEWPGTEAAYYGKNTNNEDQYVVVVPDGATGILFNNGSGLQTPDITNFNVTGYYLTGDVYNEKYIWADSWGTAPTVLTVAAGESETFTVVMNTATPGTKSGSVTLSFEALNATSFTIPCTGFVKDPNALAVDFADGNFPEHWQVSADWTATSGAAVNSNTQTPSAIVTTPLTVAENETMTFRVKRNLSGNQSYTKSLKVRYSQDGGVNWSEYKDYGNDFGSSFDDYQLTGVPAGTVIVEFLGNNIMLDDIEGFTKTTGPVLVLTEGTAAVANGDTKDFGNITHDAPATYTLKNAGNAALAASLAGEGVTVSPASVNLAAGETAEITVTMAYAEPYGEKNGTMTISSESWVGDMTVNFTADAIDQTGFVVDFENNARPAGWYNGGWSFANGTAYVYSGVIKPMITEKIGAEEGKNVLRFDAKAYTGSESQTLSVSTSTDRKTWSDAQNFTLTGETQTFALTALADGEYYVKFEALNAQVDNIKGVKKLTAPTTDLYLVSSSLPTENVTPGSSYTATVNVASLIAAETFTAELYFGEDKVVSKEQEVGTNSTSIALTGDAPAAGTYDVYVKVYNANGTVQTKKVSVTVADTRILGITGFTRTSEATVQANESNEFTATFDVTVKNNGTASLAADEVSVSITDGTTPYKTVTWTAENSDVLYMNTTKDAIDLAANDAKLGVWMWGKSAGEWGTFTKINDGFYSVDLNGNTGFIVVRQDPTQDFDLDTNWGKTADMSLADGNIIKINSYDAGVMNFTSESMGFLEPTMSTTLKVSVTLSAGEGGSFTFNAKENVGDNQYFTSQSVTVTPYVTVALNETTTYDATTESFGKVTLNRPFIAGWNTLVLPFDVDAETFAEKFGTGAKLFAFDSYNNGELTFTKVEDGIKAGTPYLLSLEAAIPGEMTFTGVTVQPTLYKHDANSYGAEFKGNYVYGFDMEGKFGVTPSGTVQKGGAGSTMKAFRAYITLPAGQNARIAIFDETTGISRVLNAKEMNDLNMFNMQGQRVNNNAKGVIIKDGKKIVRK